MNTWIATTLAGLGQNKTVSLFLHVLFSLVVSSLAVYTVYTTLARWSQTQRHETNHVTNTPAVEPKLRNESETGREPGGM